MLFPIMEADRRVLEACSPGKHLIHFHVEQICVLEGNLGRHEPSGQQESPRQRMVLSLLAHWSNPAIGMGKYVSFLRVPPLELS